MSQDKNNQHYNGHHVSEIVEMAWCDKTSFDDIEKISGLSEDMVIKIMRSHLKTSSFKLWRARVSGRVSKHTKRQDYQSTNSENA